jgi:hypothetical protein
MPGNKNPVYDPVPPYDLHDVEASSSEPQPTNTENDEDENIIEVHEERPRRMTQQECCRFGLLYFLITVVGIIIVTSLITRKL